MKKNYILLLLLIFAISVSCIKYPVPEYKQKTPQEQEQGEEPQEQKEEDTPQTIVIDTVEFNVENTAARDYMDYVYAHPYKTSDFSVTYIENYYKIPEKHKGDIPAGLEIRWTPVEGAKSYSLVISEKEDLTDPVQTISLSPTVSSYIVTNLIPGLSYHCSVASIDGNGEGKEVDRTYIVASGRRRMISVPSIGNVRDLGGLCTENGKHVKYGLIYRGSRMSAQGMDISSADKDEMLRIGIKADLDLRQDDKEKLGSTVYNYRKSPLGDKVDWKLFPNANDSYFKLLLKNDEYIKAVQWMIDELRAGKPVYFHCKTGADRTGTLAFIIESLLDVTETDKSIDFELTSFFYDFGDPKEYAFRSRSIEKTIAVVNKPKYDWGGMYELIDDNYSGPSYQKKVYNYLHEGIGTSSSAKISSDDLDWFINFMLE